MGNNGRRKSVHADIQQTSAINMSKPTIFFAIVWVIFIAYYLGIKQGMAQGIARSAIKINCHKAFGEK